MRQMRQNSKPINKEHKPIHIAHVVHCFATGGLENGVVSLVNHLSQDDYRHSIICVTSHDPHFFRRITSNNAKVYDLNKPAGKNVGWLVSCWLLLRRLKPDICHTRNLSALEVQLAAWLAGITLRIHGEHGWDVADLAGRNIRYQRIRRIFKPFVHRYVALSQEAVVYLKDKIHVKPSCIEHIVNGVNTQQFRPETETETEHVAVFPEGFISDQSIVFATVGRLAQVKNQQFLIQAFIELWQRHEHEHDKLRLIIVGDGALRVNLERMANNSDAAKGIWFTGQRDDIYALMNMMDVFVLPSLAEGISNTLLEAMACGLPVIATAVGGNGDLLMPAHAATHLVAVNNVEKLCQAMANYVRSPELIQQQSQQVRQYCVDNFSIEKMVNKYHKLYQTVRHG
jgi:sugar transferase (PEP-CTERM/EpsH1 system associated)